MVGMKNLEKKPFGLWIKKYELKYIELKTGYLLLERRGKLGDFF